MSRKDDPDPNHEEGFILFLLLGMALFILWVIGQTVRYGPELFWPSSP